MTIKKAIEILADLLTEGPQYPPDDRRDAVKLGIEALKLLEEQREHYIDIEQVSLPGETES